MKALAVALLLAFPLAIRAEEKGELVRWLVANQDGLRDVSFAEVVKAATGKRVIPVDPKKNAAQLRELGIALDTVLSELNKPTHAMRGAARVNEMSRYIEDEIRRQVNLLPGWKCTVPLTAEGRGQRSGYPDLRAVAPDGAVFYLDPKLHGADSGESTLRTFYYEPRAATGKIHDDAVHLLVGVEHTGGTARAMRLTKWELIDASMLRVQLKAEFQAGNAEIYKPEMIVGRSLK